MKLKLRGSVYVDGDLSYRDLFPSISLTQGLVIHRETVDLNEGSAVDPEGPHFCFSTFHPYLITTAHSVDEMRLSPKYRFSGPHVGSVWKSGGYLHGHSFVRRVTTMDLSLSYSKHAIHVEINGTAGPVIPGNGSSPKLQLELRVWFELPVHQILDVAPDCGQLGVEGLVHQLQHL